MAVRAGRVRDIHRSETNVGDVVKPRPDNIIHV
jgi:hypothetical protein